MGQGGEWEGEATEREGGPGVGVEGAVGRLRD